VASVSSTQAAPNKCSRALAPPPPRRRLSRAVKRAPPGVCVVVWCAPVNVAGFQPLYTLIHLVDNRTPLCSHPSPRQTNSSINQQLHRRLAAACDAARAAEGTGPLCASGWAQQRRAQAAGEQQAPSSSTRQQVNTSPRPPAFVACAARSSPGVPRVPAVTSTTLCTASCATTYQLPAACRACTHQAPACVHRCRGGAAAAVVWWRAGTCVPIAAAPCCCHLHPLPAAGSQRPARTQEVRPPGLALLCTPRVK
jgi:hypothetical protein